MYTTKEKIMNKTMKYTLTEIKHIKFTAFTSGVAIGMIIIMLMVEILKYFHILQVIK